MSNYVYSPSKESMLAIPTTTKIAMSELRRKFQNAWAPNGLTKTIADDATEAG